jgi:hypothetical protein
MNVIAEMIAARDSLFRIRNTHAALQACRIKFMVCHPDA